MSALLDKQKLFFKCIMQLGTWALANGYEATGDQWLRTVNEAELNASRGTGISHSLHLEHLAFDINWFKDGKYLQTVEELKPLGDYWKSLNPLCCWGGDFVTRPDADHFSITDQGVR